MRPAHRRRRSTTGAPGVASALLRWFAEHRRPLPWRASRDPYRVWVSEVLLQQTRVEQARPYFERFVRRFPNVRSLARATEQDVLKAWEGAGYYGRARRLRQAAQVVLRRYGGRVPSSVEELEGLPGVGPYTARAIAALAYNEPCLALEANGLRVAARLFLYRGLVDSAAGRARLERQLGSLLPAHRAGAFNEAVMELGETVCLPSRPRCAVCPLARSCRAYLETGDPSRVPPRRRRPARPHVRAAVVVVERDGRWLLQRRPADGLLGGLWEFPGGKIEPGESPLEAARRELAEETGLRAGRLVPVSVVRHGYSHFTVELHVFRTRSRGRLEEGRNRRWVAPGALSRYPLPTATHKIVRALAPERPVGDRRGPAVRSRPRKRLP